MVDNNVAYGRDNRASSFSDGDPLAELARIVGFDEKPTHVAPATRVATPVSPPVRREPEFNLEDELLREFDRYDAPDSGADAVVASPREPSPYSAPSAPAALQSVAARGMAYSPAVEPVVETRHVPEEDRFAPQEPDYPPFEDEYVHEDFAELEVDLASELEQAMDMAPSPQPRPAVVPDVASPPRMSLATPVMPPQPAAPPATVVAAPPVSRNDTLSPMEELLYDVERYSLTSRNGEQVAPVLQEPVFVAPVVSASVARPAAVATPFSPHVQEAIYGVQQTPPEMRVEPQVAPRAGTPVAAPLYQPSGRQEPEAQYTSPDNLSDDFEDDGFDLALDDMEIDLDLSDIADVEQSAVEEMRTAPASSLHFDPGQIGDTDDVPETISEVDVPALPVHEPEARPARRAEEEFDIDSELAVLFNPQKSGGGISRQGRASAPNVVAGPERAVGEDDDFERALEEDFRRSLNAPIDNSSVSGHSMPPLNSADMYEDEAGGRPRWLIPAAAAFVILAAGGGYALMNSGSMSSSSSGGPVVIAAEKGPLKVVPENPGGKTVPNQDKAVYDRVAGGEPSRPGQESLISTNEQPVDVVQRTLLPENLPLEGEEDEDMIAAAGTPVGETEDARLLPRGERPAAQSPEESPVSVSPRKVRTMIVKPDGTLVAQEVPVETAAPAATATATPPSTNSALSGLSAPSGEAAPAVVSTTTMPSANTPAASATPPVDTQVAAVPPARNATRDTAPVPSSRPSDQPANIVATVTSGGNVVNGRQTTGTTTATTPPPAETAAVSTSTPSSGGYYIQVASLPTEAEAQRSYKNLTGKFGPVIAGRGVDIKRADIAGKGTYYRVRIPAGDKAAAVTLCEKYRQAGGTCIVAQ